MEANAIADRWAAGIDKRVDEAMGRLDAQGKRMQSIVDAREEDRQKLDDMGGTVADLRIELTKIRITMELMIKAFTGAKNAAYGVIGTVVAAAVVLIILGAR